MKRPPAELVILTSLALLTRCWGVFYPHRVVFDERLVEEYAGAYFTGRFYFDVHPPLGKLLIAAAARLIGISGSTLAHVEPAVTLRLLPAVAGAMLVPLMWLLLRQLGTGRTIAALGASLVLLDNALLVQSRFILLDTMLMAFGLGALVLYLAAKARSGFARIPTLIACGVCAGASVSIKWTGLATLGLILLVSLCEAVARRRSRLLAATDAAIVVVACVAVYVASFAIHFALLRHSGPGDPWMPLAFQATLRGSPRFDPRANISLLSSVIALNRSMAYAQHMIPAVHLSYASRWYTWPLMLRPLHYWQSATPPAGDAASIHLFGNPVVWIGAIVTMPASIAVILRRRARPGEHGRALGFLAAGFAINYLPFVLVGRELFIYSYLPALLFAIAAGSYGIGILLGWTDRPDELFAFRSRQAAAAYWAVVSAALIGFVLVAPISYGWAMPAHSIYSFTLYN